MPATVFPTHDGTFIASCRKTGRSASGRTHDHALQNFHSLLRAEVMDRATEGSFETGSAAAENGRKATATIAEPADVSHAGTGESPVQFFHSLVNSSHTDEESLTAFNKRGEAPFSSEGRR